MNKNNLFGNLFNLIFISFMFLVCRSHKSRNKGKSRGEEERKARYDCTREGSSKTKVLSGAATGAIRNLW